MTFVEQRIATQGHPVYAEQVVEDALDTAPESVRDMAVVEDLGRVVMDAYNEVQADVLPVAVMAGDYVSHTTKHEQLIVLPKFVHATNGTKLVVLDSTGLQYRSLHSSAGNNYPVVVEGVRPQLAPLEDILPAMPVFEVLKKELDFRTWSQREHPEASPEAKIAQHILMQSPARSLLAGGLRGTALVRRDMHLQGYDPESIDRALEELSSYHTKSLDEEESEHYVQTMYKFERPSSVHPMMLPRRVPGITHSSFPK